MKEKQRKRENRAKVNERKKREEMHESDREINEKKTKRR